MKDLKSARQRFKSMHSESFVIPNAWSVSVGEIRQLESSASERSRRLARAFPRP
jgi:hypothetical protein